MEQYMIENALSAYFVPDAYIKKLAHKKERISLHHDRRHQFVSFQMSRNFVNN